MPKSLSIRATNSGIGPGAFTATNSGIGQKLPRGYSRIPAEVALDPRLSDRDVRVYWVFAKSYRRGESLQVGWRWIAKILHKSMRDIQASIGNLVVCGHLAKVGERRNGGEQQCYELLAKLFSELPREGACSHCDAKRQLGRDGLCGVCREASRLKATMNRLNRNLDRKMESGAA